jgi:DNA topoisomerase I
MLKLLIVESPGKIKTLRKILGKDWLLEASIGHTTELAHDGPKRLGFEFREGRIETRYIPRGSRGKQVLARLRAAVKKVDQVYLATDPDREGEAIAWHLVEQLRLRKYVRVSYTQITESAVRAAVSRPRALDFALIEAQRARQCLDKLVGYEVSPLLWNSTGGKSAGRVQSATLHLICERERERLAFKPEEYWTLESTYAEGFQARYEPALKAGVSGGDAEQGRVRSAEEAKRVAAAARAVPHVVKRIESREERRNPPPPLITSSLQQAAGMRFRFAPQKTMKIAQELYEGIGGQGLITYMRTDAVTLSPEFVREARAWLETHAPEALAEKPPFFKTKADAQGAHEAIRPTSVELTPERAAGILSSEQLKIYTLVWERAIASQCRAARLGRGQAEIFAGETRWLARGMRILELGYLRFWKNIQDERELPTLREGQALRLKDIEIEKKTTEPPSRYSEPKLVQLMEKVGIGRPSTYASTIATLKERDYVILDKSLLAPTVLGLACDAALAKAMPDLIDARFTAGMEKSLDEIAEGSLAWQRFLFDWNEGYLCPALVSARKALVGVSRVVSAHPGGKGRPRSAPKTSFRKFRRRKRSDGARGTS